MNYQKISLQYERCENFLITEHSLFILKSGKLFREEKLIFDFESATFFGDIYNHYNKYVVCQSYHGQIYLFNQQGDFLKNITGYYSPGYKNPTLLFFFDTKNNCLSFLNECNEIEKCEIPSNVYFSNVSDFCFLVEKTSISKINFKNKPFWQFSDLSFLNYSTQTSVDEPLKDHDAEIVKIIGEYKNVLWIKLNSGRLLGLSISDGNLLHNLGHPNNFPSNFKLNPEEKKGITWGARIDEENEKLFDLHKDWYYEISLAEPEESFIVYTFTDSCLANRIEADGNFDFPFNKNYIFFGARYPKGNGIGVFDRNKKEIIWAAPIEASERDFPAVKKIDVMGDKLYVLTDNGKLSIYVQEN